MKLGTIRKIGKVRDIAKIPDFSEKGPAAKKIKVEDIMIHHRPVDWGLKEDPLEKAALQGVPGSLPERIIWKWLVDEDYQFIAQSPELGGRMVIGGSVVDFLVFDLAGKPVALRIMGDYWHGPKFPDRRARDDEQFYRLTDMGYLVVDLWESDIYEAVEHDRLTAYIMDEVFK